METFCLIDAGRFMASWCILTTRDGKLVWQDFKRRVVPFESGKVLAHLTADNFNHAYKIMSPEAAEIEKMYAYRYLLDPWAREGWLSPDGKFYGCGFYGHDDIAHALLRKSVPMLEHEGWVRVHSDSFLTGRDYGREVTRRQMSALEKLGFIDFQPPGKRGYYEPDRSAPPPRCAVKPPDGFVHPHDLEDLKAILEKPFDDKGWLTRLVGRMKEFPVLAALFEIEHELIPDFGPGTWEWGIQWDQICIGSEEDAASLFNAEGLCFVKTSFDTIEITSWHTPGLFADVREKRMLATVLRLGEKDPALVETIDRPAPQVRMSA
jgi:hypothetical protein